MDILWQDRQSMTVSEMGGMKVPDGLGALHHVPCGGHPRLRIMSGASASERR